MNTKSTPDPIDLYVGSRLRLRRNLLAQSQMALAADLQITFQQVQKYERGHNRISASMLHRAARSQGVPVAFYFEGLDEPAALEPAAEASAAATWLRSPEAWPVAEAMHVLPPATQRAVINLARDLGARG